MIYSEFEKTSPNKFQWGLLNTEIITHKHDKIYLKELVHDCHKNEIFLVFTQEDFSNYR